MPGCIAGSDAELEKHDWLKSASKSNYITMTRCLVTDTRSLSCHQSGLMPAMAAASSPSAFSLHPGSFAALHSQLCKQEEASVREKEQYAS